MDITIHINFGPKARNCIEIEALERRALLNGLNVLLKGHNLFSFRCQIRLEAYAFNLWNQLKSWGFAQINDFEEVSNVVFIKREQRFKEDGVYLVRWKDLSKGWGVSVLYVEDKNEEIIGRFLEDLLKLKP